MAMEPVGEKEEALLDGGGSRRKRRVQVGQAYIDRLLEERAVNPHRSFPAWSPKRIAEAYKDKPETDEILDHYAKVVPIAKARMKMNDDILKQYDANGSAFVEISDDEK